MEIHIMLIILFGLVINSQIASATIWRCAQDTDCDSLSGSVCDVLSGACVCASGQQVVLGGSSCVDVAPYLTSPCVEDHQCSRLFTGFECRRVNQTIVEGNCFCSPGNHYLRGRCWRSVDFGAACTRDEECIGAIRNPFSMSCKGICQCADGYYERQRGDCRKISLAVGDGCVLDQDCQFPGGACDVMTLRCISNDTESTSKTQRIEEPAKTDSAPSLNTRVPKTEPGTQSAPSLNTRVPRVPCNASEPCEAPFECTNFGVCVCPVGYYESSDGRKCLAELGSPATVDRCIGLLAVVSDGICTCPPNFSFEENMRDCVRPTRRITDSCVTDSNCHTFGPAARCGPPEEDWGFRNCECVPEYAVWDARRYMCRLFSGLGGVCEVDSDCQAGDLEIHCVKNEAGQGVCTCPDGLEGFEGLCLTAGLELGDRCQHTRECNGTANTVCDPRSQLCSCTEGYQPNDGVCSPIIGGSCTQNADCVIEHTECRNSSAGLTCQCKDAFLAYEDACWPEVSGHNSTCSVTPQCVGALGAAGVCDNNRCRCTSGHHFRDGNCWPITRLMEPCTRISQCYHSGAEDKVVCRNGLCQCDFQFTYSEELRTCLPNSAGNSIGSVFFVLLATFTITLLSR